MQKLEQYIKEKGKLKPKEAYLIIKNTGQKINALHREQIIYEHLAPANILIGEKQVVELVEKAKEQAVDGFAAIEQYENEQQTEITPATDVYGLGAVLYFCLTRQVPVPANQRFESRLINPRAYNPGIHYTMSEVIFKALDMKAENRYASIKQFLKALRKAKKRDMSKRRRWLW